MGAFYSRDSQLPATGPKRISEARIEAALRKHAGIYSPAARELGVDRTAISWRVDRSEHLQAVCAEIAGQVLDLADGVIIDAMNEKQPGTSKPTKEARAMARWFRGHEMRRQGMQLRIQHLDEEGNPAAPPPVLVEIVYIDADPTAPEDEDIPV